MNPRSRRWPEGHIAILAGLAVCPLALSAREIGEAIGVSKNMVIGMARRKHIGLARARGRCQPEATATPSGTGALKPMWMAVLREVQGGRRTSREIAETIGVAQATVGSALLKLANRGLVEAFGRSSGGRRGRPEAFWRVRASA
jgi:DNA-binding transcriptional ArsR family regulator